MRTHLLPNLLKNIHQNYKNNPSISLFEIGRTYHPTKEFFPAEEEKLAMIHADSTKEISHETYYEVKGWVESLLNSFNIHNYQFQKISNPEEYMHPHIAAEIITKEGQSIGKIYRIHPNTIKNFSIKSTKASYAELNLGHLLHLAEQTKLFQEIPKFPDMEFDLSVIVDDETTHQEITQVLSDSNNLIINTELFDIFEDADKIGKGKKACAYRMTIRSLERTLTDEDLAKAQKDCINALQQIGGVVRTN
jgi:phenylalanyl-tRNA synthetase beta chain